MAIKSYIYQSDGSITAADLDPLLAPAASPVLSNVTGASLVVITLDDSNKTDLDEAMDQFGFTFVGEQTGSIAVGRRDHGVLASDPTDPAPQLGDYYYNSTLNEERWYDGTAYVGVSFATDPLLDFTFATGSPATVLALSAGAVVEWAKIVLTTSFDDPSATLQLGTTAAPGAIINSTQNDPFETGVYATDAPLRVVGATGLILTISPGASIQGAGYVLARVRQ